MPIPDTCRRHPEAPVVAQCLKHGHGVCAVCLESEPRCSDPELYCKFRPQCLIHFREKELARENRAAGQSAPAPTPPTQEE
jgi:hypothetical protein